VDRLKRSGHAIQPYQWAAALFGLHLGLSLLFCFVISPRLGDATSGLDPDGYGQAGETWYLSGRFDAIDKAPLYPGFVALVAWLGGGYRLAAVQTAQCLLSALACVLLYMLFRRTLDRNEGMARTAGLLCAIYPMTIWYTPRLWTETFLTFGIALYTLALFKLLQEPAWLPAILCGCCAGFIALSKGIALVFIPLTVLVLAVYLRRAGLRPILLFGAAALLWVVPWTARNAHLTGAFLPIHTDGGYNFYLGNGFVRHWRQAPFSYVGLKALTVSDMQALYDRLGYSPQGSLQQDQMLLRTALDEIAAAPTFLLRKLAVQSLTFWYLAGDTSKSLLTGALQIPVAILALPGILRAIRRRSWASLLLVPVIGIMGVSVLIFAFARLAVTILPYLIGLAVYGVWPIITRYLNA
jgi:hypothetical protein